MVKPDLIIIGHIMIETIYLSDGSIVGPVLGSPAAYSSVAASSLNGNIGLVTNIGKDMPYYITEPIIKAGVDAGGINIKGEDSRSTKLTYDRNGNKKVSYYKVAPVIMFEDIPKEYLDTKTFFVCPMDFDVSVNTISKLKGLNKLMMTDLGGFGGTVSTMHPSLGSKEDKEKVKEIVSNFDIVKASIEDCQYLFGESITYSKSIEMLHSWGGNIVILTMGGEGSFISNKEKLIKIPVFKTKTIDTTGAGDVYCAAFITEYIKTGDLYKSGSYASVAASIITEKTGGVCLERMPRDEEVKKN